MAQKRENRLAVRVMPWRNGLLTAGQQTSIPEDALWQAKNVTTSLDGMISKRPGLRLWGQILQVPDSSATDSTETAFTDFLAGTAGYVTTDNSSGKVAVTTDAGHLQTNVTAGSSNENTLLSYAIGSLPAGDTWALRFVFKGTNLPAYTAAGTVPNTFSFRAQGASGSAKEFAIWSGGIYWKKTGDSTYELVPDSENAGAGGWNTIEVRVDDAGNTTVYLNDTLIQTVASSNLKDVTLTGTSAFEFRWEVEGTGSSGTQYSTQVTTPMYNDTDDSPFVALSIVGLTDFQYITKAGSQKRALLCAAGNYIYHDNGLAGAWRPLRPKQHSNVFFFPYRRTMVWSDNDGSKFSSFFQWNGSDEPELLEDAPFLQFGTEHRQRILAAGDRSNPLRLYFSGDRQPDVWFSPSPTNVEDQFETSLNAGYLEIPSKKGDEITAVWGDFYGIAVVFSRRGAWQVTGDGINSFAVQSITLDVGCESANCITQVGNDLWFLSRQGVHSLQATSKFGDIQTQFVSSAIQDLWGSDPETVTTINKEYLREAKLDYNPEFGFVYVAVPLVGEQTANNIFVYNVNTGKWYGPWSIVNTSMVNVEIASPILEVIMHGDDSGRVGYADLSNKVDFGTDAYLTRIESAYINGRSLDPKLEGHIKTFKTLRLFILPRGDYDYTLTWWVDAKESQGPVTRSQNIFKSYVLGTDADSNVDGDFRLDLSPDGILRSSEEMAIAEFRLDVRGYSLSFTLEEDDASEDLVIQGYEVEFTAAGYEVN